MSKNHRPRREARAEWEEQPQVETGGAMSGGWWPGKMKVGPGGVVREGQLQEEEIIATRHVREEMIIADTHTFPPEER